MTLALWKRREPLNGGMTRLRDEMERTFERFLGEPLGFGMVEPKMLRPEGWMPPMDISETDTEVTIRAEIPGIAAKDVDVQMTGRTLTISGKKEEREEKEEENYYQCERRFGSFRRVFELPESADPDKVTAESDNGVITIHIGKKPGARPKQVEIRPVSKRVAVT